MEFLSDQAEGAASDVLVFVREAIHRLPHLRSFIVHQLLVSIDLRPLLSITDASLTLGRLPSDTECQCLPLGSVDSRGVQRQRGYHCQSLRTDQEVHWGAANRRLGDCGA